MGEQEFDELMGRALTSYSAVEPLAGLEERVLGRLRGMVRARGSWGWALAGIAVLASVMILGVVESFPKEQKQSEIALVHLSVKKNTTGSEMVRAVATIRRRHVRRSIVKPHLSQEELALVKFVARDPEAAAQAFSDLHESMGKDLTAEPIRVAPIEIASLR